MPSLEERERPRRSLDQSDLEAETNALRERIRVLQREYGKKERTVFAKTRQLGISSELKLRVAAVKLGLLEDPVRSPIYLDDLPHR